MAVLQLLRWFRIIHVWLHRKIKLLVLVKVLSIASKKNPISTMYLFISLLQQTELFNSELK